MFRPSSLTLPLKAGGASTFPVTCITALGDLRQRLPSRFDLR